MSSFSMFGECLLINSNSSSVTLFLKNWIFYFVFSFFNKKRTTYFKEVRKSFLIFLQFFIRSCNVSIGATARLKKIINRACTKKKFFLILLSFWKMFFQRVRTILALVLNLFLAYSAGFYTLLSPIIVKISIFNDNW